MILTLSLVAAALFGVCVGSFLNVVIYRLPLGTFFSGGKRSHCRTCDYQIQWYDNLPVVSWLALRGKCRSCKARISARYPLVEVLTGVVFAFLLWWDAGAALAVEPPQTPQIGWETWGPLLFKAYLLSMLIASTFIDIDHRILPDALNFPTMWIGLIGALVAPGLVDGFAAQPDAFDRGAYSVAGMAAGWGLTEGIRVFAGKVFGQDAMGMGDVKFMAAIGSFVGWDGALTTFFLGSLFGAVYGVGHKWITGEGKIFFGPFLALGAAVTLFFKHDIVEFMTVTWPQWQAQQQFHPAVTLSVAAVACILLVLIVRRGRRNLEP